MAGTRTPPKDLPSPAARGELGGSYPILTPTEVSMSSARFACSVVLTLLFAGAAHAQSAMKSSGMPSADELNAIRTATEKYRDVKTAIADGYVLPMSMCVTSP